MRRLDFRPTASEAKIEEDDLSFEVSTSENKFTVYVYGEDEDGDYTKCLLSIDGPALDEMSARASAQAFVDMLASKRSLIPPIEAYLEDEDEEDDDLEEDEEGEEDD